MGQFRLRARRHANSLTLKRKAALPYQALSFIGRLATGVLHRHQLPQSRPIVLWNCTIPFARRHSREGSSRTRGWFHARPRFLISFPPANSNPYAESDAAAAQFLRSSPRSCKLQLGDHDSWFAARALQPATCEASLRFGVKRSKSPAGRPANRQRLESNQEHRGPQAASLRRR